MAMVSPRVSVILPIRDAEDTLTEAVESILGQDERNLELLAIDDGSFDAGPVTLRELARRDHRIHVLPTGGGGIVNALNLGLENAQARYLARMDADDVSHPERLSRQLDFLDTHPEVGLVSSRVEHWTPDGSSRQGYAAYVDWSNELLSDEDMRTRRFVESPIAHPAVVFRKSLVGRFGGYREGSAGWNMGSAWKNYPRFCFVGGTMTIAFPVAIHAIRETPSMK